MKAFSQVPVYNLKVVLNETGIKADALRVWEKRYGLPAPTRSSGGQRLYSRYDIEMIRWLMARQEEGCRISQAVERWHEEVGSGVDPLSEVLAASVPVDMSQMAAGDTTLDGLCDQWIQACLAFDESTGEQLLNQAFAFHPVEIVCDQVLQAALRKMGEAWYQGTITVQQEHFASALAIRRLETLIATSPRPMRRQSVLLACTPNEWHTFPVLILSLLLRRRGLNVIYLGANTPSSQLVETARLLRPNLLVLVAQQLVSAASLRQVALMLNKEKIQMAFGGWIFNRMPDLCSRIPAHYLGGDIEQAAVLIDQLCSTPRPTPMAVAPSLEVSTTAQVFRRQWNLIERDLLEILKDQGMELHYFETGNHHFSHELLVALEMGDPAYIAVDVEWIGNMLSRKPELSGLLKPYMAAYCQSVEQHLGAQGRVITAWMQQWLQNAP